jgi:hypothetical protein
MMLMKIRSEYLIIGGILTQNFCSFSRGSNRPIESYATIVTTQKMDNRTSQDPDIIESLLLN